MPGTVKPRADQRHLSLFGKNPLMQSASLEVNHAVHHMRCFAIGFHMLPIINIYYKKHTRMQGEC